MKDPVDRAIRAIARRNSYALVWAQFGIAHLITEATRTRLPPTCSIEMVERDGIELRGRQAPMRLWAPVLQGEGVTGDQEPAGTGSGELSGTGGAERIGTGGRERVRAEPVAERVRAEPVAERVRAEPVTD